MSATIMSGFYDIDMLYKVILKCVCLNYYYF